MLLLVSSSHRLPDVRIVGARSAAADPRRSNFFLPPTFSFLVPIQECAIITNEHLDRAFSVIVGFSPHTVVLQRSCSEETRRDARETRGGGLGRRPPRHLVVRHGNFPSFYRHPALLHHGSCSRWASSLTTASDSYTAFFNLQPAAMAPSSAPEPAGSRWQAPYRALTPRPKPPLPAFTVDAGVAFSKQLQSFRVAAIGYL
ncbi:hypothetical protein QBC33DRAFT_323492 [Phialemonium atrogriseum]|uniref:Uncharacterized protein n=1 Tax=Phialemonium atrogriseum TaxID=1093897 RepID=A0AAJ0FID1_9PEZI|nr:uncharacterized protein QBC33DRAFT_323492 [Phialemonium atrogriseum]KAK1769496.1 hypothetical protein QBC33DRAFT_323492 [Phialemonium atrogriseum]